MAQEKVKPWDEVNGNTADHLTAFLKSTTDAYAIFQLRRTEDTTDERFESIQSLQRRGKAPVPEHYEAVYSAALSQQKSTDRLLEDLYVKFNLFHPADFRGHSLSVSDVVALKIDGVISCHFVDSIGFQRLSTFENHLKNAEIALEDDYNMIDGVINNGVRPSVLEQLARSVPPAREQPHKRKEMERD